MKIKNVIKKKKFSIPVLLLIMLIVLGFYGPLYPWSPVKISYKKTDLEMASVYVKDKGNWNPIIYQVDEIMKAEEDFHGLKYKSRIKIFCVADSGDMKRFVPYLEMSDGAVNLGILRLIFLGPVTRTASFGLEAFLKHELSHALLVQNTSIKKALQIHRQSWLAEGTAVFYSGLFFYNKCSFAKICRQMDLKFDSIYPGRALDFEKGEMKFKYSLYGFFVQFLIEKYGMDMFREYVKEYIKEPENYKKFCLEIYGESFKIMLSRFEKYVYGT
ncbi:hypothetical protein ACFL4T_06045 [candidate division KSB1 bacterium]